MYKNHNCSITAELVAASSDIVKGRWQWSPAIGTSWTQRRTACGSLYHGLRCKYSQYLDTSLLQLDLEYFCTIMKIKLFIWNTNRLFVDNLYDNSDKNYVRYICYNYVRYTWHNYVRYTFYNHCYTSGIPTTMRNYILLHLRHFEAKILNHSMWQMKCHWREKIKKMLKLFSKLRYHQMHKLFRWLKNLPNVTILQVWYACLRSYSMKLLLSQCLLCATSSLMMSS